MGRINEYTYKSLLGTIFRDSRLRDESEHNGGAETLETRQRFPVDSPASGYKGRSIVFEKTRINKITAIAAITTTHTPTQTPKILGT